MRGVYTLSKHAGRGKPGQQLIVTCNWSMIMWTYRKMQDCQAGLEYRPCLGVGKALNLSEKPYEGSARDPVHLFRDLFFVPEDILVSSQSQQDLTYSGTLDKMYLFKSDQNYDQFPTKRRYPQVKSTGRDSGQMLAAQYSINVILNV